MKTKLKKIKLSEIAHARSGDKGNHSNIGVIAYSQAGYDYLNQVLTAPKVKKYFKNLGHFEVVRYSLENIIAFNFVIKNILDGGGGSSLHIDTQGKVLGTALLDMELNCPANFKEMKPPTDINKG